MAIPYKTLAIGLCDRTLNCRVGRSLFFSTVIWKRSIKKIKRRRDRCIKTEILAAIALF
ncbi:MAG: hypothetical protein ACRC2R_03365 [Xenococcaceae cyanobacterium]